jgi:Ca2+-binding EF-hand superfamily protein
LAALDTAEGLFGGPYTAFQRMDRDRDDFVTAEEIVGFLRDNQIYDVQIGEAKWLVEYFDCDEDAKLNYAE